MNKDITILVNSCDKYEDAWEPFFKLLKIHWPECENYRIILNTETKVYNCAFLNVETVCGGKNITWSKRLKNVLRQIDSEVVLCILEDFFLQQRVNNEVFLEALDLMYDNKDIGYLNLKYSPYREWVKEPPQGERFVSRDLTNANIRLAFMVALWRREWLVKLLRNHEDPWEFEHYGSVRSRRYEFKVLQIRNDEGYCAPVFCYDDLIKNGYGITHGQWLPKNKELFDKYGIEVDFDKLGINYKFYEDAINPPIPEQRSGVQKENFDVRELLYNIKKWPKKQKEKLIKTVRKIRSLI